MKKICLEHLEPGMILAQNVRGLDGSTVIDSGTQADADVISLLDTLGMGFVYIEPASAEADRKIRLRQIETYVRKFFMYVDPDAPVFKELFRILLERTWDALNKGWEMPCESDLAAESVEHMRDLFFKGRASYEDIVKHETSLSSFPDIYFRIKKVLDSPTSSAADIAKVVSMDPSMSSKLLRLVNSPIFGFAAKVDSIPHAVSLAGTKEISTLALGISAINFFKDIPAELIDMKIFWRHSISCAMFSKLVAAKLGLPSDRFFTAGLLHDTGRLIMYKNMPYASVQSLLFARSNMVPLVEAEQKILGFDHVQVAGNLLEKWEFPEDLRQLIISHHDPFQTKMPREAAVVQLADNMANAVAISESGMYVLPGMSPGAWDELGLEADSIQELVEIYDESIQDITSAFM
ncbi:MAG: HDOD domain-containing protein [Desulfovibrio sp.]|uniref:HDOD domain-containing protein n=1 Tax=Desulfovibrio sp. 7SRBS1 TaxID=3378064 RepID=UPI003B3C7B3C